MFFDASGCMLLFSEEKESLILTGNPFSYPIFMKRPCNRRFLYLE